MSSNVDLSARTIAIVQRKYVCDMSICMHRQLIANTHIHPRTQTHTYTHTHIIVYVCIYIHIYVYIHVHSYVHTTYPRTEDTSIVNARGSVLLQASFWQFYP